MTGWEGFKPLGDRLLVKRLPLPQAGLIVIPDAYADKSRQFEVVAVSDRVSSVKPGDRVVLPGCAGDHPDFEDGSMALVREGDIGVVVEG